MSRRLFDSIEDRHGVNEPGYQPPTEAFSEDEPEPKRPVRQAVRVRNPLVAEQRRARRRERLHRIEDSAEKLWRQLLIAVALTIIYLAWHAGTFDRVLYDIGLNAKECAPNGFGAVFCGKELDEYRERISPRRETEENARPGL